MLDLDLPGFGCFSSIPDLIFVVDCFVVLLFACDFVIRSGFEGWYYGRFAWFIVIW